MTATGTPPALNTAQYSPSDVAAEVVNQGGSSAQAWVAAALVDGIESNGTLNDSNPSSTACGLFQFLTTTWISNGGGAYANTACGATLQQQVAVFLKARPERVDASSLEAEVNAAGTAVNRPRKKRSKQ